MKRVYLIFLTLIPYNNIPISPRVFVSRSRIMFEIMRFLSAYITVAHLAYINTWTVIHI